MSNHVWGWTRGEVEKPSGWRQFIVGRMNSTVRILHLANSHASKYLLVDDKLRSKAQLHARTVVLCLHLQTGRGFDACTGAPKEQMLARNNAISDHPTPTDGGLTWDYRASLWTCVDRPSRGKIGLSEINKQNYLSKLRWTFGARSSIASISSVQSERHEFLWLRAAAYVTAYPPQLVLDAKLFIAILQRPSVLNTHHHAFYWSGTKVGYRAHGYYEGMHRKCRTSVCGGASAVSFWGAIRIGNTRLSVSASNWYAIDPLWVSFAWRIVRKSW